MEQTMEQTFMTIHNLTPDANVLFASDSIQDILGYQPDEVQGKSCFDYFHPDEVPFARSVHSRGVLLDKAAVLHYARILARDGQWVSCECCFTVVHDVLVACTSIYRRGEKSERRAIEAPHIRRLFSCSPRDPRYHMLEHLSPKFKMPPMEREPRAALILNRFTRSLNIMFATNAVSTILGLRPDEIKDKAFYECIQENCLEDAVRCLESAKANESIAYLRFWFRDPRTDDDYDDDDDDDDDANEYGDGDEDMEDGHTDSGMSDSEGGVRLSGNIDLDPGFRSSPGVKDEADFSMGDPVPAVGGGSNAGTSASFASQDYRARLATGSSLAATRDRASASPREPVRRHREPIPSFELEAVVSCTSDGLVVVLRRARPPIPPPHPPLLPAFDFENGLFAAPWGLQPIRPYYPPELLYNFQPPLLPQYMPLRESVKAAGGPPLDQLMRSIRDVAVFAWALVGINGNLAAYGRGLPRGDAQPDGLPVWDPHAANTSYRGPDNQAALRWAQMSNGKASDSTGVSYEPHYASDPSHGYRSVPHAGVDNYTYGQTPAWPGRVTPYCDDACEPHQRQRQHHHHDQLTYMLPPQAHTRQQLHQQAPLPPPAMFHGPPQEPWPEVPTSRAYNPNLAIPTTQAPSPGDPPRGFRYMWQ